MSKSTIKNDDTIVQILEDKKASKDRKDDNKKNKLMKDFAISPKGDFVVEFVMNDNFESELQVYNINKDLHSIDIPIKPKFKFPNEPFKFIKEQLDLIKKIGYKNIFRWSITVSDKSTSLPEFRLLALSCINLEDMKSSNEPYHKKIENNENNGLTFVFMIKNNKNNNYSICNINGKELPIKYGGIKGSIKDIQKLKYPKRMYNAIINNLAFFPSGSYFADKAYQFICKYIEMCLSKYYLLIDTAKEGIGYIELYDLMTNQLVNTFQRKVSNRSIKFDVPSYYVVSNDAKLFAYVSLAIKGIKVYLIECGLEIAELVDIFDDYILLSDNRIFIDFFPDDETIFVCFSKDTKYKCFFWNIFSSFPSFVKSDFTEFTVQLNEKKVKLSNKLIVIDQGDKLAIYDDLNIHIYLKNLKEGDIQVWKKPSSDTSDLHKDYSILEPWLITEGYYINKYLIDSFYIDEKKKKLLIGSHTIQVWRNLESERRSLEFIYVHIPPSFRHRNTLTTTQQLYNFEYSSAIEVTDIEYCIGKFKLAIHSVQSVKDISTIIIEEDFMDIAKYACLALNYFSVYKKFEMFLSNDQQLKLDDIIEQTRRIIMRFIRLYPTAWRLLDIRYDLMSVLIEAKDYGLVNHILSCRKLIHVPHSSATICNAISDNIMSALFLEYYSNNAINNIGWMDTVVEIIPELYKSEEKVVNIGWMNKIVEIMSNNKKKEKDCYAQKLFNHPCFCSKKLDLLSFEFLEISPALDGLLKIFIPITQLIPQDSELDIQKIDPNKLDDIRMVPLPNFTISYKKRSDIRNKQVSIFQNFLICPILSSRDFDQDSNSPFIKIIKDIDIDILCENPSMNAIMNWIFILLGFSFHIGLTESSTTTEEESDNPFSNIIASILAVYDWPSISFDAWNFWPLTIISIIGSFVFVIILQNVIISFMSDAITDAVKNSRSIYSYQVDFIHDFALLDRVLESNDLDYKFKAKLRAKYICFCNDTSITKSWNDKTEKIISESSPEMQIILKNEDKFRPIKKKEIDEIDKIEYWFF
ncbi:12749_t:CDS:2 [Cetraspora pellucida]|uniref:12749_t:CDS:1 n=1 Tax=Cetraspora pellucida TaxID=1433469 RepID=A0A9N9C1S3_9GLOM|nr:12749_t:CDS:2 [Cetraspora pellucida]